MIVIVSFLLIQLCLLCITIFLSQRCSFWFFFSKTATGDNHVLCCFILSKVHLFGRCSENTWFVYTGEHCQTKSLSAIFAGVIAGSTAAFVVCAILVLICARRRMKQQDDMWVNDSDTWNRQCWEVFKQLKTF